MAGLVQKNNVPALAEVANNLEVARGLFSIGLLSRAICARRDTDPAAVQNLGKIATGPNPDLRGCAAQALKDIHTRDTLPYLTQLLDSDDKEVRAAAMGGLSRFVDNVLVGSLTASARA